MKSGLTSGAFAMVEEGADFGNHVDAARRNAHLEDDVRVGKIRFGDSLHRRAEFGECAEDTARVCGGGVHEDVQVPVARGTLWTARACAPTTRNSTPSFENSSDASI